MKIELTLPGSMPERLMGTDCKFVGKMSTLVQIQLGPRIHWFTIRWRYLSSRNRRYVVIVRNKSNFSLLYTYLDFLLDFFVMKNWVMLRKSKEKTFFLFRIDWKIDYKINGFGGQFGKNQRITSHLWCSH